MVQCLYFIFCSVQNAKKADQKTPVSPPRLCHLTDFRAIKSIVLHPIIVRFLEVSFAAERENNVWI